MTFKPDAVDICNHIDQLQKEAWLTLNRKWWPKYLFHFTDIKNAARIIESRHFTSRSHALQTQQLVHDIADPEVIQNTSAEIQSNVRLYFRPLTNMQWAIEGFIPRRKAKHCPVPIVFLLDSKSILSLNNSRFSDGNLGSRGANIGNSADFFRALPFPKIYHAENFFGLTQAEQNKIKFHRHAEVIVPDTLDTSHIRNIWCRSAAEYQTLLNLLPQPALQTWERKIGVGPLYPLFHRNRNFIEDSDLNIDHANFNFHLALHLTERGPFHIKIVFSSLLSETDQIYIWEQSFTVLPEKLSIPISNIPYRFAYRAELMIDGSVACIGVHNEFANLF